MKPLDKKYMIITAILLVSSIAVWIYMDQVFASLDTFFGYKWPPVAIGIVSAVFSLVCSIKENKIKVHNQMTFGQFRTPYEILTACVSNPISLMCSFTLARGLFLHWRKKGIYFPNFSDTELTFIALIATYLLYDGIGEFIKNFKSALTHTVQISVDAPAAEQKETAESQV